VSSDLLRARATATEVASVLALGLEVDARLRELDVGRWSGLTRGEIEAREPEILRAFERGEPDVRPGGGETRIEIRARSHAFVCDLVARYAGERILVVTHLGVIRALVPGAQAGNLERIEVEGEAIASRPIDRGQRAEEGPL
jgi:probable phosphoglycerate mutase